MPVDENKDKWACEPCIRGHRSTKCEHFERIMVRVNKPGRPLTNCPHDKDKWCSCVYPKVMMVRIGKGAGCNCAPKYFLGPGNVKIPAVRDEHGNVVPMQDPRMQRRRHPALIPPLAAPTQPTQQQQNPQQQPQQILQQYPLQFPHSSQQHSQVPQFDGFQGPGPPVPLLRQQQQPQQPFIAMGNINNGHIQQQSPNQPAYFVNQPFNVPNPLNVGYTGPATGNIAYRQKGFNFANGPDVAHLPNAFHGAPPVSTIQHSNVGLRPASHSSDGTMPPPSVQVSHGGNMAHGVNRPNAFNYPAAINSPATNIPGSNQISAAANAPSGSARPASSHSSHHSRAGSGTFEGTYQGHNLSQISAPSPSGPSSSSIPSSASLKSISSVASSIPSPTVAGMIGNSEDCNCGDDCNCALCPVHYFNPSTVSGMQRILRTILEDKSEEDSPTSMPDYVPASVVPSDVLLSPTDHSSGMTPIPYLSAPPEHPDQTQGAMGRTMADNGDTFIYLLDPTNMEDLATSGHLANTGTSSCCTSSPEVANPNMAMGDFFEGAYNHETTQFDEQFS